MTLRPAFFRSAFESHVLGAELIPEPIAGSGWGTDHMRGLAVSAALARAAEQRLRTLGRHDLRPVRWSLDLFRPVKMRPCTTSTNVVRQGRRLCLIDCVLHQDHEPVARAGALFLSPSQTPPGHVWSGAAAPQPPPVDHPLGDSEERLYRTERSGWVRASEAQNSERNQIWQYVIPTVAGEEPTPFQLAAGTVDVMNVVSNLGDQGLEYINPDATLLLARLPEGPGVGLSATGRVEQQGISVGSAVVFDRGGVIGTATVSGLANAHHAVDVGEFFRTTGGVGGPA